MAAPAVQAGVPLLVDTLREQILAGLGSPTPHCNPNATLRCGLAALSSGLGQLDSGSHQFADGAGQLSDGLSTASSGSHRLAGGLSRPATARLC